MTNAPDPYARSTFHGKPLDNATIAALKLVEDDLGYELTILQGIGGATASAGTHLGLKGEGGRAVDLVDYDTERKVKALKRRGFAVWRRPYLPGVWGEHIHAVLIFESAGNMRGIAAAAWRQIQSFLRGRDGLKGDGPDPTPWRVDPQPVFTLTDYRETFEVPVPKPVRNNITRARNRISKSIAVLDQAAALLDDVDPKRVKAKAQLDDVLACKRKLETALDAMPKQ